MFVNFKGKEVWNGAAGKGLRWRGGGSFVLLLFAGSTFSQKISNVVSNMLNGRRNTFEVNICFSFLDSGQTLKDQMSELFPDWTIQIS